MIYNLPTVRLVNHCFTACTTWTDAIHDSYLVVHIGHGWTLLFSGLGYQIKIKLILNLKIDYKNGDTSSARAPLAKRIDRLFDMVRNASKFCKTALASTRWYPGRSHFHRFIRSLGKRVRVLGQTHALNQLNYSSTVTRTHSRPQSLRFFQPIRERALESRMMRTVVHKTLGCQNCIENFEMLFKFNMFE